MKAKNLIPVVSVSGTDSIKAVFEQFLDRSTLEAYRLPVENSLVKVIIGMSGGADSTVLGLFSAAYLAPIYPHIEYLFTDTGAEPKSCYETLDKVESYTGVKITRIRPKRDLFELIDSYNGFLPNSKARWCTRLLKIQPLHEHMKEAPREHGYISLAGIRYDESDRDGISFQYTMENDAKVAFPFIDLKITREMVFKILAQTVGIPSTYSFRTRSGCYTCFHQRNQEVIGTLATHPQDFFKTESYEKLSDRDIERWGQVPSTIQSLGIRAHYPVPAFVDVRNAQKAPLKAPAPSKKKKDSSTKDLFGTEVIAQPENLYVAFALYTNDMLALFGGAELTPGVYWQELITISTSLTGMKAALKHYYQFKHTTPMEHCDADDMKIVIAQIQFPAGTIDTGAPSSESFTWKKNTAYLQIRNLVAHAQNVLFRVDLERQIEQFDSVSELGGEYADFATEEASALKAVLDELPTTPGKLIWEGLYTPSPATQEALQLKLQGISTSSKSLGKQAREGLEYDEVPRACIACSI